MSESIGHFSLSGDFKIEEVTAALGLKPSWVHRKGDVLGGADFPAQVSTWDSHCPAKLSMYEQVEFLLRTLSLRTDALQLLTCRFTAAFNITGPGQRGAEVLTLTPELLERIASLNITLNCFIGGDVEDAD
jgi:hypothetical protein